MGTSSVRARRARRFIHRTTVSFNDHAVVRLTEKGKGVLIDRYSELEGVTKPMAAQDVHDQFERGHSYLFRTRTLMQLFGDVISGDPELDSEYIEGGEIMFLPEGELFSPYDDDLYQLQA